MNDIFKRRLYMKKRPQALIGVCPMGKFVFSHEDALRQKKALLKKLDGWKVNYCTIDGILPDGMVRDQKHVGPVVTYFQEKKVDALFVPHCNFGTEGAVGMIGKKLAVPVLLWGPRDEAPLGDGSRYRDSLCGMFASSKVLHKLKVPFSYIENCRLEDQQFKEGVSLFVRAAAVVKAIHSMRIGQIGVRVDFFWTTIDNESELLENFGIEVLPFDMVDFLKAVKSRAGQNRSSYQSELDEVRKLLVDDSILDKEGTLNSLALRDELFSIAEQENLDAFSIKTFTSISDELGPGLDLGSVYAQERYPIAAESDIHGAVSSILLEAASAVDEPSFFPEYTVRHPENDNAILLWHAVAPISLRHPDSGKLETFPPWILKDLPGETIRMQLKDGPLTVCRFDGETGEYVLGIGQGKSVEGPVTREFYVWMEVDDWPRWERMIMQGPYIHHCSAIYDHCADVLEEACRYIPGLTPQRFDRKF
jgi:L-fucose isomerase-like protein